MRFEDTAKQQQAKSDALLKEVQTELKGKYSFVVPNDPELISLLRDVLKVTKNGSTIAQVHHVIKSLHTA